MPVTTGIPKAISSLDKAATIIVPTIFTTPTMDQYGPIVGVPVPDSTNVNSRAQLVLGGAYLPNVAGATLVVEAANPRGSLPAIKLRRINYQWPGSDDGSSLGVRATFKRWPSPTSRVLSSPFEGNTTWTSTDAPAMFVGSDGALYAVFLAFPGGASTDSAIVVRKFDQRLDVDWEAPSTITPLTSLQTLVGSTAVIPGALTAIEDNGNIFALAFCTAAGVCQFYVTRLHGSTWSLVATSGFRTGGDAINSGASICKLRDSSYLLSFGKRVGTASPYQYDVQFALSKSLAAWGEDSVSGVVTLPRMTDVSRPTLVVGHGVRVTQTRMIDSSFGLAVCDSGAIYATTNGGKSWTKQRTPSEAANNPLTVTHPLRAVAGYKPAGSSTYTAYAVGDGGLILKTTDSGLKWLVAGYGGREMWKDDSTLQTYGGNQVFATADIVTTWSTSNAGPRRPNGLTSVAVRQDNGHVYVCGYNGTLLVSTDGLTTWAYLGSNQQVGPGNLNGIIADLYGNAMVVGEPTAFDTSGTPPVGTNAAVISAIATAPAYTYFQLGSRASLIGVACPATAKDLTLAESGWKFAVSTTGEVVRCSTTASEIIATLPVDGYTFDIAAFGSNPAASQSVLVAASKRGGGYGFFACENAQIAKTTAPGPLFFFNQVPRHTGVFTIAFIDASNLILATADAIYSATLQSVDRCYGTQISTRRGSVIFACSNLTRGAGELWRGVQNISGGFPAFELIDSSVALARVNPVTTATIPTTIPRPSLTEDNMGNVIVCWGTSQQNIRVSKDDGKTWLLANDASLDIPTLGLDTGGLYNQTSANPSRSLCAYGSRLFSLVRNSAGNDTDFPAVALNADTRYATFVAREFEDGASYSLPCPVDRPVTLVDGVTAKFLGKPTPGDKWTAAPDYRYPARNMIGVESPQIYARGPAKASSETLTPELVLTFDAGAGKLFNFARGALFGCNFESVKWSLSDPAATDDEILAGTNQWTEYTSTAAGYSGYASTITNNSYAVLIDTDANWTPHQFACPLTKQRDTAPWYITISGVTFRVIDNEKQTLTIDVSGAVWIPGQIAGQYTLWPGLHSWDGTGGTGPGSLGLVGEYEYGRVLKLTITAQPTAEGYFRIGHAVLGVGLDTTVPTGSKDHTRSIAPGFSFTQTPNSIEAAALDGVSVLAHFDQGEAIGFGIQAAPSWYSDRLSALLGRIGQMRRAIALQFDASDKNSMRLVRLADGPVYRHIARDYADIEMSVRRVV